MTDLDQAVLAARFAYRKAYREWMKAKNSPDVEARVAAHEALTAAERSLLDVARRER